MAAFPQEVLQRFWRNRRVTAFSGVLTALLAATLFLTPLAAQAITRDAVLARAQTVLNSPVPYSQSKFVDGWRNDCSGYVSWVWGTGSNLYTTRNLSSISRQIPPAQLQPGDALLKYDSHVRMFYAWADDAHTKYVAYEQTPPRTWSSIQDVNADIAAGYIAVRHNKITDSPPAWNVLRNSRFDVWNKGSKTNDGHPEAWTPVWWNYGSTVSAATSWQIRSDQVVSPAFALGLNNAVSAPSTFVEARQGASVDPGKTYTYSVSSGTTAKPSAVLLCVQFYNAAGNFLADYRTSGDSWGIGASGLKPMSLTVVAPPGAARADAILGLSGAVNPAGGAGGAAVFDDVALYVSSPLPVYRFYNGRTGAHFYTASGAERDIVASTLFDFSYEGAAYGVVGSAANSAPLHRFYNKRNGTHFYTVSQQEYDYVKATLSSTYSYDGPAYKVSAVPVQGATTVYRFFNTKNASHFYTASEAERDTVRAKHSDVYSYEGPAFYLAP